MRKTALITGASSGIGWEFAKIFAQENYDIIITARREDRLKELKIKLDRQYQVNVTAFKCDLTQPDASNDIYQFTKNQGVDIDVLVNNAGFGRFGEFVESDMNVMADMVQVNITALMELTRLFAKDMVQRKSGDVLNVSSMASFAPGPLMSVYFATKAFVTSFSEALSVELQNTGVRVSILCPGPVISEFQRVAYDENSAITKKRKIPTSEETARYGYEAMKRGELIAIPVFKNRLLAWGVRCAPKFLVHSMMRLKQYKVKKSLS